MAVTVKYGKDYPDYVTIENGEDFGYSTAGHLEVVNDQGDVIATFEKDTWIYALVVDNAKGVRAAIIDRLERHGDGFTAVQRAAIADILTSQED